MCILVNCSRTCGECDRRISVSEGEAPDGRFGRRRNDSRSTISTTADGYLRGGLLTAAAYANPIGNARYHRSTLNQGQT